MKDLELEAGRGVVIRRAGGRAQLTQVVRRLPRLQEGHGALVQCDHEEVGDLRLGHDVHKLCEVRWEVGE